MCSSYNNVTVPQGLTSLTYTSYRCPIRSTNPALGRRLRRSLYRRLSRRSVSPIKTPAVAAPVGGHPCTRPRQNSTWRQTARREASTIRPWFLSDRRRSATGNTKEMRDLTCNRRALLRATQYYNIASSTIKPAFRLLHLDCMRCPAMPYYRYWCVVMM